VSPKEPQPRNPKGCEKPLSPKSLKKILPGIRFEKFRRGPRVTDGFMGHRGFSPSC
jgi:hypothetical protein